MVDVLQALKRLLKETENIVNWQQEIYTALHNIDASWVTTGRFALARLPTSSTANRFLVVRTANADPVYDALVAADIPSLDASKITTGTFDVARIPNLDASKITSGTFDVARIPNLDASKITSGRFTVSRLPDGSSGYVLVGQGSGYDLAWRDISGIAGVITDSQHGTRTSIPFAHHGDWGHYGKIPTSAPSGAAERAYVDSANLYVHDGTSWVLRATKDWNSLINKPSSFPPSAHASTHALGGSDVVFLDASQITSGRFSLSRIPTSSTANRVLLVRTANADPTYDQVDWNTDIKNKPSTFPPSAHASTHEYGGSDLVRNLDYLAIRGTTVIDSSRNLANVVTETLSGQTADPSLAAGKIWFRSDLKQIRWSPDGSTVKQVYPADWGDITSKPSTFPPSAHTHSRSDVTDFWSSPFWTNIPDKPSSFPPSAHASTHEYGGSDLVRNLDYLAIRGTTVIDSSRNLSNIVNATISGGTVNITPSGATYPFIFTSDGSDPCLRSSTGNYGKLGTSTYYLYWIYSNYGYFSYLYPRGGTGTGSIGDSGTKWSAIYVNSLNGWNPDAHVSRHESGGSDAISGWISPSNIGPRSDSATYLRFRTKNIAGSSAVDHKFCPTDANYGYLGDSTYYWYTTYANAAYYSSIYPREGNETGLIGVSTLKWYTIWVNNVQASKLYGTVGLPQPLKRPLKGLEDLKRVQFREDGLPLEKTLPTHISNEIDEVRERVRKEKIAEKAREKRGQETKALELTEEDEKEIEDTVNKIVDSDTINICHTIGWLIQCIKQLTDKVEQLENKIKALESSKPSGIYLKK
jgi:hypothetical protein